MLNRANYTKKHIKTIYKHVRSKYYYVIFRHIPNRPISTKQLTHEDALQWALIHVSDKKLDYKPMNRTSFSDNNKSQTPVQVEIVRVLDEFVAGNPGMKTGVWFKTGEGQYAEDDVFIPIKTPQLREVSHRFYKRISLDEINFFLISKIHEYRQLALFFLTLKFLKGSVEDRDCIVSFYLDRKNYVNNWDLVDCSAPVILGNHLLYEDKSLLYVLGDSKSLWDRRIAIVSTLTFIKHRVFDPTLQLAEKNLCDSEDLIQKASGWALRELGKQDKKLLENFLENHADTMPRTMLRYSLEKFPEPQRRYFMQKKAFRRIHALL